MAAQLSCELQGPGTGRTRLRHGQSRFRRVAPCPYAGRVQALAGAGGAVGGYHRSDVQITQESGVAASFTSLRLVFLQYCPSHRATHPPGRPRPERKWARCQIVLLIVPSRGSWVRFVVSRTGWAPWVRFVISPWVRFVNLAWNI